MFGARTVDYWRAGHEVHTSDLRDFPQRHCVHAIAQATGRRAIREHVPEVCVTGVADSLDPFQERGPVETIGNHILLDRLGK